MFHLIFCGDDVPEEKITNKAMGMFAKKSVMLEIKILIVSTFEESADYLCLGCFSIFDFLSKPFLQSFFLSLLKDIAVWSSNAERLFNCDHFSKRYILLNLRLLLTMIIQIGIINARYIFGSISDNGNTFG